MQNTHLLYSKATVDLFSGSASFNMKRRCFPKHYSIDPEKKHIHYFELDVLTVASAAVYSMVFI